MRSQSSISYSISFSHAIKSEKTEKKRKTFLDKPLVDLNKNSQLLPIDSSIGRYMSLKYDKKNKSPFCALLKQNHNINPNAPMPVELGRYLYKCRIKFKLTI